MIERNIIIILSQKNILILKKPSINATKSTSFFLTPQNQIDSCQEHNMYHVFKLIKPYSMMLFFTDEKTLKSTNECTVTSKKKNSFIARVHIQFHAFYTSAIGSTIPRKLFSDWPRFLYDDLSNIWDL